MDLFGSKSACHEQLDLNAPLISTRHYLFRFTGSGNKNYSDARPVMVTLSDTSRRVPFLWETAPGVPKFADGMGNDKEEVPPPPPKLPPSRWCPAGGDGGSDTTDHQNNFNNYDDGNDGDVDDGSQEDVFSDAVDMISVSESMGAGCYSPSPASQIESLDMDSSNRKHQPSSFIIDRFLPAAHALASSSTPNITRNSNGKASQVHHPKKAPTRPPLSHQLNKAKFRQPIAQVKNTEPHSSPISCGLMLFLPWSLKQTLCGYKSPVRSPSPENGHKTRTQRVQNRSSDHALNSGEIDRDDGFDDSKISTAWAGGWGSPFLECGRWDKRGKDVDSKKKVEICLKAAKEFGGKVPKKVGSGVNQELRRRQVWSLPSPKAPSESWLSKALNSTNKE